MRNKPQCIIDPHLCLPVGTQFSSAGNKIISYDKILHVIVSHKQFSFKWPLANSGVRTILDYAFTHASPLFISYFSVISAKKARGLNIDLKAQFWAVHFNSFCICFDPDNDSQCQT